MADLGLQVPELVAAFDVRWSVVWAESWARTDSTEPSVSGKQWSVTSTNTKGTHAHLAARPGSPIERARRLARLERG